MSFVRPFLAFVNLPGAYIVLLVFAGWVVYQLFNDLFRKPRQDTR